MIFLEWTDAEIVMLAVALNNGALVHIEGDEAEADRLNTRLFAAVQDELKRREVHPNALLRLLVARAVTALTKEKSDASG